MWKSLKKSSDTVKRYFLFKWSFKFSEQYIVLVFMILSALLIWFLSTEMLVNVGFVWLENHEATFKLKSIIHGFANKVRQSYRGEFNFV